MLERVAYRNDETTARGSIGASRYHKWGRNSLVASPGSRTESLQGAKLIDMRMIVENPLRTVLVSLTEQQTDQEVTTFYR